MTIKNTSCIILAAGLSSRMGSFKPLLPIGGKPAIQFLTDKFFDAGIENCIIVTGYNADRIHAALAGYDKIIWAHNPDYAETGMFESASAGFLKVPPECSRVLMTPADIPLVSLDTVRALAMTDAPVLCPRYQTRKGHPVSVSAQLIPDILNYRGNDGLRGALNSLTVRHEYLDTDDPYILMDMDTPADYDSILSELSAPGGK